MKKKKNRDTLQYRVIQPIAMACVFVSAGFLIRTILKLTLDINLHKNIASLLNFGLASFAAFIIFPRWLKKPFAMNSVGAYLKRLGFYFPKGAWKHILLGVVLAVCTVFGMWFGSFQSGRYVLDWNTLNLNHLLFCLNPGIWEEFFFRGIIMLVLLKQMKSIKAAALIQITLFGLAHIKGGGFWGAVDVFSVILISMAFLYTAFKTRALLTGIVFHFIHDFFIYFSQVPGAKTLGTRENLWFFLSLWTMLGIAILLIKVAADKLSVKAETELYVAGQPDPLQEQPVTEMT